jgi:glucose dehydrogenase
MIARALVRSVAILPLAAAARPVREWRDAAGPDSSRFVAATRIAKDAVARLQPAWT